MILILLDINDRFDEEFPEILGAPGRIEGGPIVRRGRALNGGMDGTQFGCNRRLNALTYGANPQLRCKTFGKKPHTSRE
jgi:hypothetical protein